MDIFLHLLNSTTLITSIALLYGTVQRALDGQALRHVVLGMLFGAGASLSMLQPMVVSEEVIVDSRRLFLGFAGAFAGPMAAAIAFVLATTVRVALGASEHALVEICLMFVTVLMGLLWSLLAERLALRGAKGLLLLGVMISTSLFGIFFLPSYEDVLTRPWIPALLVAYNIAGALTLGGVILRDRRRARRERAAQQDAETDPLTGLLNRRNLDQVFEATTRRGSRGSVLFLIDIDRFKGINDRFGHAVGDRVLRAVAQSLRSTVRDGGQILRLGGEEFAIFLGNASQEEARAAGARIVEQLRMTLTLSSEVAVSVTSSVGAHHWQRRDMSFAEAYEAADAALYAAKESGRDCLVFTLALPKQDRRDLRRAI